MILHMLVHSERSQEQLTWWVHASKSIKLYLYLKPMPWTKPCLWNQKMKTVLTFIPKRSSLLCTKSIKSTPLHLCLIKCRQVSMIIQTVGKLTIYEQMMSFSGNNLNANLSSNALVKNLNTKKTFLSWLTSMQFVQQINTESSRRYFYLNAMDKYKFAANNCWFVKVELLAHYVDSKMPIYFTSEIIMYPLYVLMI